MKLVLTIISWLLALHLRASSAQASFGPPISITEFSLAAKLPRPEWTNETSLALLQHSPDRGGNEYMGAFLSTHKTWPEGQLPYRIDRAFDSNQRMIIAQAMLHIQENAPDCVRFVPYDGHHDYVDIVSHSRGCFANMGNAGGRHVCNLQIPGCLHLGIVVHELLHNLGALHEHVRPDRDSFIRVNWNNVRHGTEYNFWRTSWMAGEEENDGTTRRREPVCFGRFGINGAVTIEALDGTSLRRMRATMSELDAKKLRRNYACDMEEDIVPDSDSCPSSHPFAYLGGLYCCRYNKENSRPHLDSNCDGEDLKLDSTCCYDDKYKKCQSFDGRCKNYQGDSMFPPGIGGQVVTRIGGEFSRLCMC